MGVGLFYFSLFQEFGWINEEEISVENLSKICFFFVEGERVGRIKILGQEKVDEDEENYLENSVI